MILRPDHKKEDNANDFGLIVHSVSALIRKGDILVMTESHYTLVLVERKSMELSIRINDVRYTYLLYWAKNTT